MFGIVKPFINLFDFEFTHFERKYENWEGL